MPTVWTIAIRFLRQGRFQTLLVIGGVIVGSGVVIFLSALISGLQQDLIAQTLRSQPHVIVEPLQERVRPLFDADSSFRQRRQELPPQRLRSIRQWQQQLEQIDRVPGVQAVSPSVVGNAFGIRGTANRSIALTGIVPERFTRVVNMEEAMVAGHFRVGGQETVIGSTLAAELGLEIGEVFRVRVPEGGEALLRVAGIFDLGNEIVNDRWVLVPLRLAQSLLDLSGGVTRIEIAVDDIFSAPRIAEIIRGDSGLRVRSWQEINRQLLIALRSQSSSSSIIQFFVTVTVALGVASVLMVSVIQRTREIGIMRAFGTTTFKVMGIFLLQGGLVGLVGALLGSGLGAGLALSFAGLTVDAAGDPLFPVLLPTSLFIRAVVVATLVGIAAAGAPAWKAATMDPAEAIHNA